MKDNPLKNQCKKCCKKSVIKKANAVKKSHRVNVDDISRKVLGLPKKTPFNMVDHKTQLLWWNINDVFRGGKGRSEQGGYKTGKGIKLVYDFIMSK